MKPRKEHVIVRFHKPQQRNNKRHGYCVFMHPDTQWVFVTPTFSSADSVHTEDGWDELDMACPNDGWLYAGHRLEFADMATRGADIRMPQRTMLPREWLYSETMDLYARFMQWHQSAQP